MDIKKLKNKYRLYSYLGVFMNLLFIASLFVFFKLGIDKGTIKNATYFIWNINSTGWLLLLVIFFTLYLRLRVIKNKLKNLNRNILSYEETNEYTEEEIKKGWEKSNP